MFTDTMMRVFSKLKSCAFIDDEILIETRTNL